VTGPSRSTSTASASDMVMLPIVIFSVIPGRCEASNYGAQLRN
jgi:hypothetical protein